jgi:hypothetical protein
MFPEGHDSTEDNDQNWTKWPSWRTTASESSPQTACHLAHQSLGTVMQTFCVGNYARKSVRGDYKLLEAGVLILHDNTRPHSGRIKRDVFTNYERETLPNPTNSPHISPHDFSLSSQSWKNRRMASDLSLETVHVAVSWRITQRNSSGQLNGTINYQKVGKLWWALREFDVSCLTKWSIFKLKRYCALLLGHPMQFSTPVNTLCCPATHRKYLPANHVYFVSKQLQN